MMERSDHLTRGGNQSSRRETGPHPGLSPILHRGLPKRQRIPAFEKSQCCDARPITIICHGLAAVSPIDIDTSRARDEAIANSGDCRGHRHTLVHVVFYDPLQTKALPSQHNPSSTSKWDDAAFIFERSEWIGMFILPITSRLNHYGT